MPNTTEIMEKHIKKYLEGSYFTLDDVVTAITLEVNKDDRDYFHRYEVKQNNNNQYYIQEYRQYLDGMPYKTIIQNI